LRIGSRIFLVLAGISLLAAAVLLPCQSRAQAPDANVQVIEVTAKKYEYNPGVIRVKKGVKVELKIKALDKTHGFKIAQYPDGVDDKGEPGLAITDYQSGGWKVEKDKDTVIDFVANTPGTYSFRCSVFCGFGHMGMKGQIVVEP